jgi:hypothetical protein
MLLASTVRLKPDPIAPISIELGGQVTVFGVTGTGYVLYVDEQTADKRVIKKAAYLSRLENFDIQALLSEIGVNADLGPFNLRMTKVQQTYSTAAIPLYNISIGLNYYGDIEFLGKQGNFCVETCDINKGK